MKNCWKKMAVTKILLGTVVKACVFRLLGFKVKP